MSPLRLLCLPDELLLRIVFFLPDSDRIRLESVCRRLSRITRCPSLPRFAWHVVFRFGPALPHRSSSLTFHPPSRADRTIFIEPAPFQSEGPYEGFVIGRAHVSQKNRGFSPYKNVRLLKDPFKNRHCHSLNIVKRILKRCETEAVSFTAMDFAEVLDVLKLLPKTITKLHIEDVTNFSQEQFIEAAERMRVRALSLLPSLNQPISRAFLMNPVIQQLNKFKLIVNEVCEIDDDLLRNWNVETLELRCSSTSITLKGIAQVLEDWELGKRDVKEVIVMAQFSEPEETVEEVLECLHECSEECRGAGHVLTRRRDCSKLSLSIVQYFNAPIWAVFMTVF